MENLVESNENGDNNEADKIIKPIQQQQQQQEPLEIENNLQQQQQQQQPDGEEEQHDEGLAKQIETPGEKALEQPLLPEEFHGEEEEDEEDDDDDDDDEEKETSQKLIIDIPDEDEEKDEEDEDEDDDVIALDDDVPPEEILPPKADAAESAKNSIKKPEPDTIITLSDGEEDIPANDATAKPGKVQKRRSVGANATAGIDEERYRLKRRKINVAGAPKMPLTG